MCIYKGHIFTSVIYNYNRLKIKPLKNNNSKYSFVHETTVSHDKIVPQINHTEYTDVMLYIGASYLYTFLTLRFFIFLRKRILICWGGI